MKRTLTLFLALLLLFSMTGCAKKATVITPAPEVLAFQESQKDISPNPKVPYDNETSVKDLPKRSVKLLEDTIWGKHYFGATSTIHGYTELKNNGLGGVIRYNCGIYYSITPLDDGSYLVLRYLETTEWATDSYRLSVLNDVSLRERVGLGMNPAAVNRMAVGEDYQEVLQEENGRNISFANGRYYLADLTCLGVHYDWQENQLKANSVGPLAPEDCILSYLLPQDLELLF